MLSYTNSVKEGYFPLMLQCGALVSPGEETRRVAGSPILMWSPPGVHHQGPWGLPRIPLYPSTHAPSSCRPSVWLKFRKQQVQEANLWKHHFGAVCKVKREVSPSCSCSSGGKPIPDGIVGSQPVTLVVKEDKEEGFYQTYKYYSRERILVLMISGAGQSPGGYDVPRSNPGNWRGMLSVLPVSNKITSDTGEWWRKGSIVRKWETYCSYMNVACHKGTARIPFQCERWQ